MGYIRKYTQKDVEFNTLKDYLRNEGIQFFESLIDYNTTEPTDIRYNNINYQITIGDQEAIEERRKNNSKKGGYVGMRKGGLFYLEGQLLFEALRKKVLSSDSNTTLLIKVVNMGIYEYEELEELFNQYSSAHPELRGAWKEIYVVLPEKNIQIFK
ncbi:MAG: hypothetical protein COU32_02405 [Candidatus Magasanikbacteria bacterium CG10_big_fil_rev_8_21_14_0_10_42_10]|uniref:Uncharacterized protein n=1 Tax=Candidatus Magasanikbacteria bacterium CG10_big_fil_rev_8_21_14_0_10_42_10 TaxID=1974649 RepID=A0A2H0TW31_9BACT|nr:MAG: hypothetical protein COU32_02405 [Candidatus Magasanikbacteria bacterium CG10_big_fil_rev_8_21_14_0_10_42_10]